MRIFKRVFLLFSRPKKLIIALLCLLIIPFSACSKEIKYTDYVSELRSNIFLAETDDFHLRIYAVAKETPYLADGAPREISNRCELYLVAPSFEKDCMVFFTVNGVKYGGEMSFDTVKSEYFFSCTLDISKLKQIDCTLHYGGAETKLCAQSVVTEDTLSSTAALSELCKTEKDFFAKMTDAYGFTGEICIRLLYEDAPYYYVGVIDRDGKTTAFLLNGKTGKVLAKRER